MVETLQLEKYQFYRATLSYRRGGKYRVRPELEANDGKRYLFMVMWEIEDHSLYPGEWAMGIRDAPLSETQGYWVASGDLTDWEPVPFDEGIAVRAREDGDG